jgi:hypothetical protein
MLTGPSPKFHETRDILSSARNTSLVSLNVALLAR